MFGGNLISILDVNGNILTSGTNYTVATTNPFRYRGYYYYTETGFYYLNSRYYDPQVGRFINADGIVGANGDLVGYNQFAYCSNNPVIFADDSGYVQRYTMMSDGGSNGSDVIAPTINEPVINEKGILVASEHHKRGTTNKANKKKHELGQARKQRDNNGEKGDARRTPNPNKRRPPKSEVEYGIGEKIWSGVVTIGAAAAVVYFIANDVTGVGVADDAAILPMIEIFLTNATKVFS